jgi:hypothetical protein
MATVTKDFRVKSGLIVEGSTATVNGKNLITAGIVDAKGDLIAATAADTVARLAVGANDTVLTADSTAATGLKWATPAAGGMTLISTTTLTGASVTLSSIPQTYNNLYLVIQNFKPATDNEALLFRFNNDSTANRHFLTYYTQYYYSTQFSFNNNYLQVTSGGDNSVSSSLTEIEIPNYTNTTTWKMAKYNSINTDGTTSTQIVFNAGAGLYNQTGAISSIGLLPSAGNFTSGTALLYGVK